MVVAKEVFECVAEADKPWKHAVQVVILIRNSYQNVQTPETGPDSNQGVG